MRGYRCEGVENSLSDRELITQGQRTHLVIENSQNDRKLTQR